MSMSRARKRLAAGIIVVVATVAGIAFATFVSEATTRNSVKGGELTVTTNDLPLAFGTQTLYPSINGAEAIHSTFGITNGNPVDVQYALTAIDTNRTTKAKAQYQLLHIKISSTTPGNTASASPLDDAPSTKVWYDGYLKDLTAKDLGMIAKAGARTYDVSVWLESTPGPQDQNLVSTFDLKVTATTPTPPGQTSTPLVG